MSNANEPFSFTKFLSGPLNPSNYAKAIVFLVCLGVMAWVGYSSYYTVRGLRDKKAPIQQTEQIGTVNGPVTKTDSHDTESKEAKSYSLINLLCKN